MANFPLQELRQMAPDAASWKAAQELARPEKWLDLTASESEISGEHQGSSPEPYRARVELDGPHFRCSCPSRKIPCKHSLGLLALYTQNPAVFAPEMADQTDLPLNSEENLSANALPADWAEKLGGEFEKPYFSSLGEFLTGERRQHQIYPPAGDVFNAFRFTPFNQANVLILGEDPYHGPNQAHGLAFSVQPKIAVPPSLQNMFLELKNDVGCRVPNNGFLKPWADQGVLLLNAVLTVRRGEPNSHKGKGWEKFSDAAITALNERESRVVFVLWGAYARKKKALIDLSKHLVVESAHPSPLSAHTGFFGSKPFSQVNAALKGAGKSEINWQIPDISA